MLHKDVRSCGGNHLVPVLFHSHPVLRSEAASGSSVAQLHTSLSPCQTPLAGTAHGASQLLLVHAGSEADGSAPAWEVLAGAGAAPGRARGAGLSLLSVASQNPGLRLVSPAN